MALKPTTCKEAIARWEKEKGEVAAEAKVIELQFQWPPIEKMDGALSTLVSCDPMAVLKPTSCKEAIARWEKTKGEVAADAPVIELQFQWPPIDKMDGALSTLVSCTKLSLSTNMIDKIAGIAGMRSLKILSLGRNYLKSLSGIETVADTLEELWISYNSIDKMKGIGSLKQLRVLYMCNNSIKEWVEFNRLQECPALRDLVFIGNPICENQPDVETWRTQASNRLQQITKLDGIPVLRE